MLNWLKAVFCKPDEIMTPEIGRLRYIKGLGWKGKFPNTDIEFVIGAERGDQPSDSATTVIGAASANWEKIVGDCLVLLKQEIRDIPNEPMPISFQLLWPEDDLEFTRLEFSANDDDRVFYVEMTNFVPTEAGFDH